jgi:L-amino acid N-acyltransferase YncA/heme-degrading monooxygenase HmoA
MGAQASRETTGAPTLIRPFAPGDEHAIAAIYNHYIEHTVVTFEEVPLSAEQMRERIEAYRQHHPWLVCEVAGRVLGYAYATRFHSRAAFRHTAEVTVYLQEGMASKGLGRLLYDQLIQALRAQGCRVLVGVISLPNEASVGLHEAMGFVKVGHLPRVGHKFGRWLDIGHWSLDLQSPPEGSDRETAEARFARTPEPPYYAVVFASQRTDHDDGYAEMAAVLDQLAAEQPGCLGVEFARDASGFGITVSYWQDLASIAQWKAHATHLQAQQRGKRDWYASFELRIARVERAYNFRGR